MRKKETRGREKGRERKREEERKPKKIYNNFLAFSRFYLERKRGRGREKV